MGSSADEKDRTYGLYKDGVNIAAGKTYALPYTIWMTRMDTANAVTILSPTVAKETVIKTPLRFGIAVDRNYLRDEFNDAGQPDIYSYDLGGRRTNMGGSYAATGLPGAVSTTGYDAANELTAWGTATPSYDSNGNLVNDGTNTYVWNARNQLGSMNMGAESFQYDPFGRRVGKTILASTTNYLYDAVNPVQELSGSTVTANLLTGGVDEYFTRSDSTGTANFLSDGLGSTEVLTDNSGSTLAQYTYEPFGKTTTSGSSASSYQFTGRENDGTGVYYYRARYYNPTLQRFVSEGPAGLAGGNNFYAYVGDAPSVFTDPMGLSPLAGRGCKLRVTSDCFDSRNGVRHIHYKLVTDSGGDPLGTYYVNRTTHEHTAGSPVGTEFWLQTQFI